MTLPTTLTLTRLILSPILMPLLIVQFLPQNILWVNGVLAAIFLLFSLTDFLDGYFARKLNQVTQLGKTLDHVADKFLIFSTLVALVAVSKFFFFWAIVLIGREFFVMALRQLALEHGFSLHVSTYGKAKTVAQVVWLAAVILNPPLQGVAALMWASWLAIHAAVTLGLSVVSAQKYYTYFKKQIRLHNEMPF